MGQSIHSALKLAMVALHYHIQGYPIDQIHMHSLCSGGAYVQSLAGCMDRLIKMVGRWKGSTFNKYIRDELHVFLVGMSKKQKSTSVC